MIEARIILLEAEARNCHPHRMFGRFAEGELVYALAGDGRSWTRERHEDCATFEQRIIRDLIEARRPIQIKARLKEAAPPTRQRA